MKQKKGTIDNDRKNQLAKKAVRVSMVLRRRCAGHDLKRGVNRCGEFGREG